MPWDYRNESYLWLGVAALGAIKFFIWDDNTINQYFIINWKNIILSILQSFKHNFLTILSSSSL
jgi:hypothetical protein